MKQAPRIAYDARFSIGQYRGMGRYLRRLIAGREHEVIGFCAAGERDPGLRLIARGPSFYPAWEQISIPRLAKRYAIDLFIAPYNTAPLFLPRQTRLVLIVHDLIFMDPLPVSRSIYQNSGRIYRRLIVPRAVARAELIVTVSRFTASSLAARFGINPERLRIIPNSIGEEWFVSEMSSPQSDNYILMVAGESPGKNLNRALDAFALCQLNAGHLLRMKVAGVKPAFHAEFAARARSLGVGDHVEFLSYLSDDSMRALYRNASVLFMPSLAEGFGIPVLEAMASGAPVVTSNASSLPEIGGDAALYVDPTSTEHMAKILHQSIFDLGLRARMVELGRIQARKFHPAVTRSLIDSFWEQLGQSKSNDHTMEFAS